MSSPPFNQSKKEIIYFLVLTIFQILIVFNALCQSPEVEIKSLSGEKQIEAYWYDIFQTDQRYRSTNTNDSIDNLNFKKVLLMIKYHGYPKDNITPNVVFIHQLSNFACEYYFPVFHNAYLSGVADTFWFMQSVRRLHRGRFGRDLVQPDTSNYQKVIERMLEYIPDTIDMSIHHFDSLFLAYTQEMESVVCTQPVKQWKTDNYGTYHCILYCVNDHYFLHRRWERNAILPQKVFYDKVNGFIHYEDNCCNSYFLITPDGNLQEYHNETHSLTYYPYTD